jgi:phosphate-selective porin OprO/OprP
MNFNKKIATAVSGAVLLMAGQVALADSSTDIVDALVSKGVLTEEEGKLISKGAKAQKDAQPVVKEKDGAFSISSPNGKNSIQLTGRLHFDTRVSNRDDFLANGTGNAADNVSWAGNDRDSASMADHYAIRRARIGVKGRLGGIADYEAQMNLVGSSTLDVAYIDINKYEPFGVRFGKFKVPYNLEEQTSSNNIDFVERSYINQNAPSKKLGVMAHGEFVGMTYAADLFQMNDDALSMKDNKFNTAGRATVNFAEIMGNKDMILHAGLAGFNANYQVGPATSNNQSDNASKDARATVFGFRSAGGGMNLMRAQVGTEALQGTGYYGTNAPNAANVKANALGLEGIAAYNNFKLQGEYSVADYESSHKGSKTTGEMKADVDTWYGEALWLVTGEKYSDFYKKGAFGSIKPKSEFSLDGGSGLGAIELGFRVDGFDVSNTKTSQVSRIQGPLASYNSDLTECATSTGCDTGAKTYTLGAKWVWNPNMLFKISYAYTKFDNGYYPIDILGKNNTAINQTVNGSQRSTTTMDSIDSEQMLMVRGQYMF